MIRIPAGKFTMGSEEYGIEKPPHKVIGPLYRIRVPLRLGTGKVMITLRS